MDDSARSDMYRVFGDDGQGACGALRHKKFRVEQLPQLTLESRWLIESMHSLPQPLLLWFMRGRGRITVAGTAREYNANHAVFVPPGIMHGYEMFSQAFGTAIHLPDDGKLGLPKDPIHCHFRETSQQVELAELIDNITRELKNGMPGRGRALRAHAGLLSAWLRREANGACMHSSNPGAARRLAAAYAAAVEKDFRSGRGVKDYAARLGVTPTHLTRACKAASGRSASAVLADRVHFEARKLLRNSQRPVKCIAAELGFSSAAYFTCAFQKQTGKTPSAFRKAPWGQASQSSKKSRQKH